MEIDIIKEYAEFFPKNFIGLECGKGWNQIIVSMFESFRKNNSKIHVVQIKEKFGFLRVYVDFPEDLEAYKIIKNIIAEAEIKSHTTCELCGMKSKITNKDGWYYNYCIKCQMLEKIS